MLGEKKICNCTIDKTILRMLKKPFQAQMFLFLVNLDSQLLSICCRTSNTEGLESKNDLLAIALVETTQLT